MTLLTRTNIEKLSVSLSSAVKKFSKKIQCGKLEKKKRT